MYRKRLRQSSKGFRSRLRLCTDKIMNQTSAKRITGERCNSVWPRRAYCRAGNLPGSKGEGCRRWSHLGSWSVPPSSLDIHDTHLTTDGKSFDTLTKSVRDPEWRMGLWSAPLGCGQQANGLSRQ